MDHVHTSLRRWFVALVFACLCASVFGATTKPYPVSQGYLQMTSQRAGTQNFDWGDGIGACMFAAQNYNTTGFTNVTATAIGSGNFQCRGEPVGGGSAYNFGTTIARVGSCATGDTLKNGTCYPPGTDGPPPADCSSSSVQSAYIGAWVVGSGGTAPDYACIQGCQYPQGSTAVGLQSTYGMSIGKGNGKTCSGANYTSIDTTTKPSDPPSPVSCGKLGLVYGTVNGVGICAKGGEIPGTSVTKNDSSTTTKTDASGVQAAPQTTNTTTNVTNNNGVSTVTQTTTKPDGTKETTSEPKDVFCARKPDDALCKTSSEASGGDDCKVAPVCKGDAIQCAMLSQQWKTRCDNQQTNVASDLATQVLGGNDPSKNPADKANRDTRSISNSIDQTAFLNGSGLQDKVVTVSGQAITLPFSRLNQYLEWIGRLFVVISLIGAIRIVLGGFKK